MPARSGTTTVAPPQDEWSLYYSAPPWTLVVPDGNSVWDWEHSYFTGATTPDFHKLLKAGELLPYTPWTQFFGEAWRSLQLHYTEKANPSNTGDQLAGNWNPAISSGTWKWRQEPADLQYYAARFDTGPFVQQSAATIYAKGHDTLTFLAEVHKINALFKGAVGTLVKLMRGKSLAQAWLEYRYGWRILYYDMVEISETLANLSVKRKRFAERSGTSHHISEDIGSTVVTGGGHTLIFSGTNHIQISLRGSVVADIEPPKFQFNPVLTTWELITFSFVVDWFIGIGQWLESLSFMATQSKYVAAGGVYITSSSSTLLESMTSVDVNDSGTTGESACKSEITIRTPTTVNISNPFWRVNLDAFKVLDLISLIFGGKPSKGTRA